jgi:hypothetical protein
LQGHTPAHAGAGRSQAATPQGHVLAFVRRSEDDRVLEPLNLCPPDRTFTVNMSLTAWGYRVLLG